MKKIDKYSPLPLHYQLKQIILEMIENDLLKPGECIPPEREICEIQGVSRMTVNKAIMSLVNEGVLYREQGKGTFVAKPKISQQLFKLKGYTKEMMEKGFKPATELVSFVIKTATKQVKASLDMAEEHNEVIEITRLRLLNGEPHALEVAWIPKYLFEGMTRETVEGKSLYSVFTDKYGYELGYAKQTIEPVQLNEYEAGLLEQSNGALALLFGRTTCLKDGTPVEYTKATYRSDKYKYEVTLS